MHVGCEPSEASQKRNVRLFTRWGRIIRYFIILSSSREYSYTVLSIPASNRVFSTRNGNEYTDTYAKVAQIGRTHIKDKKLACILDGEVVGWDAENGVVVPFGSNR